MIALFRHFPVLPLLLALQPPAVAEPPGPEAYRKYALTHDGDAARGAKLFNDQKLICANCHSVDGRAGKAGPDLFAAGDAFGRRDLVDAVLTPSTTIAPGYGTVFVLTSAGAAFQGVLKQKTATGLQLMGADGKLVSIANTEIKEQTGLAISLMPEALHANLTVQEFTDVIEYLTTLKQAESTLRQVSMLPKAASEPRIRQNLALVVGLQGRFDEARKIASEDLPPDQVEANMVYLQKMLSQPNTWQQLSGETQG